MKKSLAPAFLLVAAPFATLAQNNPWDAPISLGVGLFHADATTSVRLDANGGRLGTQLSFEGDLGGEERKTLPTFDFTWRFNPRHALEGSVVSLHRDGQRTLSGTINWGEVTFPVNTSVDSEFNSDIVRVAYRYSPWHDDRMEVGFLLGLHYTKLETSITASAGTISQEASVKYPLPTLGVRGSVRIADNWRLAGFGQVLKVKISDYDGELYNLAGGVEWAFTHEMIAGLGYEYYKYNLVSSKDRARGEFDYRFDGPKLYFSWNFR
jgi:opacity protein-like surface antigen